MIFYRLILIELKLLFIISIILANFLFLIPAASASGNVSIPDTVMARGERILLPVQCNFSEPISGSAKLKLVFYSLMVDVPHVFGGDTAAFKCPDSRLEKSFAKLDSAIIYADCENFASSQSSILCMLETVALAGPDSIAYIRADSLFVDGSAIEFGTKPARILILGEPVYQKYPERISNNFPNPFTNVTCFPLSIKTTDKIEFEIYNTNGDRVLSSQRDPSMFRLTKSQNPISDAVSMSEKLERGSYYLHFAPEPWKISAGVYFIQMITDNAVSNINFVYLK